MKKKLLLILGMFIFITNVNALTFNVDITNIEDKGNGGTIGSIENIDVNNKSLDVLFQDIGDEVNFEITVTNEGDRAGTLRNITFEPGNDKIEYSSNLPDGGLAINGNDTNKVTVTAKVKEGAVNGKTTSTVKIKYSYDEGSCPDGEILSDDESMCLCPEGMERNEQGICVKPEKPVECAEDEIYNEQKKICEKKVVPVVPSNPKTLDNIILITLLFIVSGLGIYAAMFKRLKTDKKKITGGVVTGVITLSAAFIALASVFGIDNLLGAIINPITKNTELTITVNEEIDLIETWDGECSLDVSELTPDNIFQDGSGTESDPYQIKTAEQLSCFAKSVNNDVTYEGQYIKQIKHIKLNDHLNDQATNGDLSGAHVWTPAGYDFYNQSSVDEMHTFNGTYDGDNHIISGLYINSTITSPFTYKGLFGTVSNATFKNMILSDVYIDITGDTGTLIGRALHNLTIDNVTTYGNANYSGGNFGGSGVLSWYYDDGPYNLRIENTTNNINLNCKARCSGIVDTVNNKVDSSATLDEPNIVLLDNINNGNITISTSIGTSESGGLYGRLNSSKTNILIENNVNTGDITLNVQNAGRASHQIGGIIGMAGTGKKFVIKNSSNTGNIIGPTYETGGIVGWTTFQSPGGTTFVNCYNSGNIINPDMDYNAEYAYGKYLGGISGQSNNTPVVFDNCFNSGDISGTVDYAGGIVGHAGMAGNTINKSYNTGNIIAYNHTGGLFGEFQGGNVINSYNNGSVTVFGFPRYDGNYVAGLGHCLNSNISNSYNTGEIISNGYGNGRSYIGGLCTEANSITNSYNRGNITSKYVANYIGGIAAYPQNAVNVYNSGNITFENLPKPNGNSSTTANIAGISGYSGEGNEFRGLYNIGNIIVNQNGGTAGQGFNLGGIVAGSAFGPVSKTVNTGNITASIKQPFTGAKNMVISGIITDTGKSIDGFNSGVLTIDDSASPIAGDGFNHSIYIGEIAKSYYDISTGNKFTNTSGFALGCYQRGECTLEESQAVGISTEEDEPSILSIINGDDAFEIKSGESLPTLKVFNQ